MAWTACGSDDDSAVPGAAGAGTHAGAGGGIGEAGEGNPSAGKSGAATGGHSGAGSVAGGSSEAGASTSEAGAPGEAGTSSEGGEGGGGPVIPAEPLANDVDTIVVIYAENRSFDGLYGNFPDAHGLSEVIDAQGSVTDKYVPQKDRDGTTVLPTLPKTWTGVTAPGNPTVIPEGLTGGLPNKPFGIEQGFVAGGGSVLTTADVTRDLTHRFFENIMEINGGTNDMFAAWLDAGGLTMGHFDYSASKMYKLAQDYVLADNFFEGAFGGSFLNHQYLICACAPSIPAANVTAAGLNVLADPNAKGVPQLALNPYVAATGTTAASGTAPSALDSGPSFKTGYIAPLDYFGPNDGYRGVNTMQPAYQPSSNLPPATATDTRYADPTLGNTLVPQTQTTNRRSADGQGCELGLVRDGLGPSSCGRHSAVPRPAQRDRQAKHAARRSRLQTHHHPFNFYAAFDPATHSDARTEHLRDYTKLLRDIAGGTVPHVAYYKPTGNVNQHPGYANADDGDTHIADLVSRLKAGPQWAHMVIVITYDEYGGQWDHVSPPKADKLGPGTRIPALIISPFAKAHTVDHTQYDTGSISRLISRRFATATLPGIAARDAALVAANGTKMGDLTNALTLP